MRPVSTGRDPAPIILWSIALPRTPPTNRPIATEDSPGSWSFSEWDNLSGSIYGFGEDEDGELYVLQGSSILRFNSDSGCPTEIFTDGFESGDTTAWSSTVP